MRSGNSSRFLILKYKSKFINAVITNALVYSCTYQFIPVQNVCSAKVFTKEFTR